MRGLMAQGVEKQDNPHVKNHKHADFLPRPIQAKASAWEEAPLLDDPALSASYRATVFNLGLVGVRYELLDRFVEEKGRKLATDLKLTPAQLLHMARCLLDEMRRRGALSRPMLCYHPSNPNCPDEFKEPADWERRVKTPRAMLAKKEAGLPATWTPPMSLPASKGTTAGGDRALAAAAPVWSASSNTC
ncbi:hypothetical protein ACN28S_19945 [Cystobacter fuscus]